jgi:mono/diheme cytochrome c family protein
MTRKFLLAAAWTTTIIFLSCNSGSQKSNEGTTSSTNGNGAATKTDTSSSGAAGNQKTGVGKFQHVELTHPLDQKMIASGKSIYELKCASCHKLTDEKLVGPGWKGVTDRRSPEWIMNFVTNTEEMLEKNQEAKNLYEVCLVKMPNQNLSDEDARSILEFQRNNDGKK